MTCYEPWCWVIIWRYGEDVNTGESVIITCGGWDLIITLTAASIVWAPSIWTINWTWFHPNSEFKTLASHCKSRQDKYDIHKYKNTFRLIVKRLSISKYQKLYSRYKVQTINNRHTFAVNRFAPLWSMSMIKSVTADNFMHSSEVVSDNL